MRILVIGAGATVEEASRSGLCPDRTPPVVKNFAQTLWSNSSAYPQWIIEPFLKSKGIKPEPMPNLVAQFVELENTQPELINIERFYEFAWQWCGGDMSRYR